MNKFTSVSILVDDFEAARALGEQMGGISVSSITRMALRAFLRLSQFAATNKAAGILFSLMINAFRDDSQTR
jgi:hypothetical protein